MHLILSVKGKKNFNIIWPSQTASESPVAFHQWYISSSELTNLYSRTETSDCLEFQLLVAQSAGALEYTDCTSEEE